MDSVWEHPDGTWTSASYIVREMFTAKNVTPAESYFVVHALGIAQQFASEWDNHQFFERAGFPSRAIDSIDPKRDGRIALAGDLEWAAGNAVEARRLYQQSLDLGRRDSTSLAGLGGLLRLAFVNGEFRECIVCFRRGCPPHEYFVEAQAIRESGDFDNRMAEFGKLEKRYRKSSSCFISTAKYMSRAIIAAGVRCNGIDDELRSMICDYFSLDAEDVEAIEKAVESEKELDRLRKRVAPKERKVTRETSDLHSQGDTPRAACLRELIPRTESFVIIASRLIGEFLRTGDTSHLDSVMCEGCPFGIPELDSLVLTAALESVKSKSEEIPSRKLTLMRRFCSVCRYPTHDLLKEYLKILEVTSASIEAGDLIDLILDVQWYKTEYRIDWTVPGVTAKGLGKVEIAEHRDWLELVLGKYMPMVLYEHFADRDSGLAALHHAYLYMRERFLDLITTERWINEAMLGDALRSLFGESEVHRHARPVWLSPQHLDFYLPRYSLAVEYMGVQHFEPVEHFGGEDALTATRVRDERKRDLCKRMGIDLVYVTHTEDVAVRAREIYTNIN